MVNLAKCAGEVGGVIEFREFGDNPDKIALYQKPRCMAQAKLRHPYLCRDLKPSFDKIAQGFRGQPQTSSHDTDLEAGLLGQRFPIGIRDDIQTAAIPGRPSRPMVQ